MKISYNWLRSYIHTDLSPEKISEILTDTGLEVEKLEAFETIPGALEGVVVGEIIKLWPHPNADKLNITQVDLGDEGPVQIVCGAPNAAEGQKVLVATVGTTLLPKSDQPFHIKKAKIRGEESFGMICAEDELGIGSSHDGILVLPANAKVGTTAAEFLNIQSDHVFEIGLTPNRTDAMGHIGVARDLAARLSLDNPVKITLPKIPKINYDTGAELKISVEIIDKEGCGRYAGIYLKNVEVGASPAWMQNFLRAIGQTPINNVVDAANFVQFETGQPLHAFDADRIAGGKIIVDTLPEGQKFITLDGVERTLHGNDLMICDENGGLCIAGVFGGSDSGVTENTQNIFLESAWFNPVRVRKTAKRHGLNTDASFRFERGVDPQGTLFALERVATLIEEITGGAITGPLIDIVTSVPEAVQLDFSIQRFNALSGTDLDATTVKSILHSLDFEILKTEQNVFTLQVPTYRVDVTREIDVVEEVLRIYGYNRVNSPDQMRISLSAEAKPTRAAVIHAIRLAMMGRGFNEMVSNGLTRSDRILGTAGEGIDEELIHLLNPLSQELDVLRSNLEISALEAVSYNVNRQADRLKLFEIGKVYFRKNNGFAEHTNMVIALSGNRMDENWNNPPERTDISDLRGEVEAVFQIMGVKVRFGDRVSSPFYSEAISLMLGKQEIGLMGQASAKACKQYGIKRDVLIAEFNFDMCFSKMTHADKRMSSLPKFPSVRRDFSMLLDRNISFSQIEKIAFAKGGKHLKEIGLFDVFEGKNLPEGKKSYAVRFILQDENKTLDDKQIDSDMRAIQSELESALGAQLR